MAKTFPYKAFELVMLQPTSFCNIQCDYCYLDINNRSQKNRMSFETLEKICERIFSSTLIISSRDINFMWHEGEPLMMPIDYYEKAIGIINRYAVQEKNIITKHSILTNATLVNDEWCSFFTRHNISVGVSVDGPEFIHNSHRKTRSGKGTYAAVLNGIQTMRRNSIVPYFLTTVHEETLKYPNELFGFYKSMGVSWVGLNFEEIIGNNKKSSLQDDASLYGVKKFIEELYALYKNDGKIFIREFDDMKFAMIEDIDFGNTILDTVSPYSILTVNHRGDFSTFAPELIDMKTSENEDFIFGNVYTDNIEETIHSEKFVRIHTEIRSGIVGCMENCEYYSVCGSNLPGHKYSENGSFNSGETIYCRAAIKAVADKVIDDLSSCLQD